MNLEDNPEQASHLCLEAQSRLMRRVTNLTDNADAHARRLSGALHGEDVPKYTSEIEAGACRSSVEIIADLEASQSHLEEVFARCADAGWPNGHFLGGGHHGVASCPAHRLREVEMHHVDLGLGYTAMDWPDEYVAWDLPELLATAPERIG